MDREDLPEVEKYSGPLEIVVQPYNEIDEDGAEEWSGFYVAIISYDGQPYGVSFGGSPYLAVFQAMQDVPLDSLGVLHEGLLTEEGVDTNIIQFLDKDGKVQKVDPKDQ